MDLQTLRLNTIFKLQLLNLDAVQLNRVSNRVMRGNNKVVKKVIYNYIKNHKFRQVTEYFNEFMYKKNNSFIKKLSIEQIKNMVESELESRLRHEFRRKIKTVAFQRIVDIAIDSCEKSDAKTRDGVIISEYIPNWIKGNYKIVSNTKPIDTDELYNKKLMKENISGLIVKQDANELVKHLDYINYLRKQKALDIKEPVMPKGLVIMVDYTRYLAALRDYRDYGKELDEYIKIVDKFINMSELPAELKGQVRRDDYEVKSQEVRIMLNNIKHDFNKFVLFEKYGEVRDTFWKKRDGAKQLIRSPTIILENMEENPSIDMSIFLLNSIKVNKKSFQKFYNLIKARRHIKIISMGEIKNKVYIVYDYVAPKKWFKEEFFNSVYKKLDEKDLVIDEELSIDYDFPYESFWKIQNKFTYNFMIFMNKNNLLGMSERKIPIQQLPAYIRMDKRFSNYGYLFATINSYQIYYPSQKHISRKDIISREQQQKEYFKLYSCFHGKNIFKRHAYDCGDERMTNFMNEMELMSGGLQEYIEDSHMDNMNRFLSDVVKNYSVAKSKVGLVCLLRELKSKYTDKNVRALKKMNKLNMLKKELKNHHGNSTQGKKIKALIEAFKKPDVEVIKEVRDKISCYRKLIKEINSNTLSSQEGMFKHLIYDFAEKFCEQRYYRRITIQRDVVSYAKTMANNLNITGVVNIYKKKDGDFLHKFNHQFKQVDCDPFPDYNTLSHKSISISCLLKGLMGVAIRGKMSIFDDLFDLLYDLELETKEKKLLEDLKI